jgi:hypothetical protein
MRKGEGERIGLACFVTSKEKENSQRWEGTVRCGSDNRQHPLSAMPWVYTRLYMAV